MPYNVLITRRLPGAAMALLEEQCSPLDVNPHDRPITREELLQGVRGRDGVLCLLTDTIDEAVLSAARGVRIFANFAVGYNNIDVETATRLGIMVTNTPGVLTEATADLTWALLLASARRVVEGDRCVRSGKFEGWGPMMLLGAEVSGKTLGIVGAGRIGSAVAARSRGFGMKVLYHDQKQNVYMERELGASQVRLDVLLKRSDFVSIHVSLTPQTRHLIGSRELKLMKPTAFLINTSRGPVLDEKALALALRSGTLAGAGLDVYENEPKVEPDLLQLENAVLLPHIASATEKTRTSMALRAVKNLLAGLAGEKPPNLINPGALKLIEPLADEKTGS